MPPKRIAAKTRSNKYQGILGEVRAKLQLSEEECELDSEVVCCLDKTEKGFVTFFMFFMKLFSSRKWL